MSSQTKVQHYCAEMVPVPGLDSSVREQMLQVASQYFLGIERATFEADLAAKNWVFLLRDRETGELHGFTTLARTCLELDSRPTQIFYSGDTIVDEGARSQAVLYRVWARHVYQLAKLRSDQPAFWFLISSGYRTYRFLPLFFREFYPTHERATPPDVRRRLDLIATHRFPDEYDLSTGIVRLKHPTPLRSGVADLTAERLRDPHVDFFVRANPDHSRGDELACLAEITDANLTPAAVRLLK